MGEIPWWYDHIRASQILPGVKPWEWDEHPLGIIWMGRVLAMEGVEDEARQSGKNGTMQFHDGDDQDVTPQELPPGVEPPPPPPPGGWGGTSFG